jgi:hypothetical protein
MLAKDDTGVNYRPLGIGEAERRCGCAIVATIKKAAWNKFYTSELPDVKEERLARAASCEEAVQLLKGAVVAAASQGERCERAMTAKRDLLRLLRAVASPHGKDTAVSSANHALGASIARCGVATPHTASRAAGGALWTLGRTTSVQAQHGLFTARRAQGTSQ